MVDALLLKKNEPQRHSDRVMHGDSLCFFVTLCLRGLKAYEMADRIFSVRENFTNKRKKPMIHRLL